jgi:hypothetical protein
MNFELFWSGFEYSDQEAKAFGWKFKIVKDQNTGINNKGWYLIYIYDIYGIEKCQITETFFNERSAKVAADKFVIALMNMMNRECQ